MRFKTLTVALLTWSLVFPAMAQTLPIIGNPTTPGGLPLQQVPTQIINPNNGSPCIVGNTGCPGFSGGLGAVYGPTAVGSPAANPPVQVGGTTDGTATGPISTWLVDSGGLGHVTVSNAFTLDATSQSILTGINSLVAALGTAIPAGSATIGNVGLVAGSNLIGSVNVAAAATGGATGYGLQSAASTNSTNVKASAGVVKGMNLINTTTTIYYLRMYDSASAPTCSSSTNYTRTWPVPPASTSGLAGGIAAHIAPEGVQFSNGISFCLTGGPSSTDNTNAATGVFVNIDYK